MEYKVKTTSVDEYGSRLEEFRTMLNIWRDRKEGRNYSIEENVEKLNFKIKVYGEDK